MKRTASVKKSSSVRGTSTRRRKSARARRFVVCVRNEGYEASLERKKIYTVLPDSEAERDGDLRVIDERGEDYLLSADRFVAIEVPARVRASLRATAHDCAAVSWGQYGGSTRLSADLTVLADRVFENSLKFGPI